MAPDGRVGVPESDPRREYTTEEEARLTRALHVLLRAVHDGAFSHLPVDLRLLTVLHRNIFDTVRAHAGRIRSHAYGSEHVFFGPHRSTHRDRVEPELQELFNRFHRQLAALENDPDAPGYEEAALYSAVRLHAEVIRIHPFEDGNGRTARALMNVVLVRLGLLPIPMEVPKQEYVACLNHFYVTGSPTELWDLAQELYQSLIDKFEED